MENKTTALIQRQKYDFLRHTECFLFKLQSIKTNENQNVRTLRKLSFLFACRMFIVGANEDAR